MKCDHCGAPNATAKIMIQKESGQEELNLCDNCFKKFVAEHPEMKEKGMGIDLSKIANILMTSLAKPFSEMMSQNKNLSNILNKDKTTKTSNKVCPNCKTTEKEVRTKNRLGCSECFNVFKAQIDKKLLNMCGENSETKNYTSFISVEEKIKVLTLELSEAVDSEEYELAAKIRDDITYLKNEH